MEKPKSVLGLDIDGTITKPNDPEFTNKATLESIRKLHQIGHYAVPVTGKSTSYANRLFEPNGLSFQGSICENGAVYLRPGELKPTIFGGNAEALDKLREVLCLHQETLNWETARVERGVRLQELPTVIKFPEHEDKMAIVVIEGGKHGVLTLFTESALKVDRRKWPESSLDHQKLEGISRRWPEFEHNATREEIYAYLKETINEKGLTGKLDILPPHADGAIDIVRVDPETGNRIDKALLPQIIGEMYGRKDIPIAMFGDGANDIPALTAEGVYAITFEGCDPKVIQAVREKGEMGFVSPSGAPEGLGVAEGVYWLAKQDFFGEDIERVIEIIQEIDPGIIESVETCLATREPGSKPPLR